jgi:hypothetical protein
VQRQGELLAEADAPRARVDCAADDERRVGVGAGVVDVELAGALCDTRRARRSGCACRCSFSGRASCSPRPSRRAPPSSAPQTRCAETASARA